MRRASRLLIWAGLSQTVDRFAVRTDTPGPRRGTLVVRLDGLGDFIVWLNSAAPLRSLLPPEYHPLTLLAERTWAPLAEATGCFDEVWPFDNRQFVTRPQYRLSVLRRVRSAGFAAAINPVHTRDEGGRGGPLWGDAVVRASGARVRVGIVSESGGPASLPGRVTDRWYTHLVPTLPGRFHESLRHAAFLRGLAEVFGGGVEQDVVAAAAPHLPRPGLGDPRPPVPEGHYYVLIPGALFDYRRWPVDRFVDLARRLHERTGWTGVVCGAPSEADLGRALAGERPPVQDLVGRTSVAGLVEVIDRARLVITNETAAVHFAAKLETPAVCILGGGHYGRFMPYPGDAGPLAVIHRMDCFGCNWNCIYRRRSGKPQPCIDRIGVDDVWQAVVRLLEVEPHMPEMPQDLRTIDAP